MRKQIIVGMDEVGRGSWAGPLVVGAVVLGQNLSGLADSKALTQAMREKLSEQILASAEFVGLGWASPQEIDDFGLSAAHFIAYRRAILHKPSMPTEAEIIIDGNINYLPDYQNTRCIVNADAIVPAVSAASILAKVARDKYMREISDKFPKYGFGNHVGYGTKKHIEAIKKYGATTIHRKSYQPVLIYGAS